MEQGQAQLTLPGVSAIEVPQEAIDYWNAIQEYYRPPKVTREPRNADLAALLSLSSRGWDHRKHRLRKELGRDWIEKWPPHRGWRPTWEPLIGKTVSVAQARDTPVFRKVISVEHKFDLDMNATVMRFIETYDEEGHLVDKVIAPTSTNGTVLGHLTALAAAVSGYSLMDMADGRLDGVLHLHQVFLEVLHQCARFL